MRCNPSAIIYKSIFWQESHLTTLGFKYTKHIFQCLYIQYEMSHPLAQEMRTMDEPGSMKTGK